MEKLKEIVGKLVVFKEELTEINIKTRQHIAPQPYGNDAIERWKARLVDYIRQKLTDDEANKCDKLSYKHRVTPSHDLENFLYKAQAFYSYLVGLIEDLESHPDFWLSQISNKFKGDYKENQYDASKIIIMLCEKFPTVTRQLKKRSHNRIPLLISDEHDVQYLLHSLLKIYFKDTRKEEPTPSVAGSHSKIDFLLVDDSIAIETKMASDKLGNKELKQQLLVDIADYKEHQKCDTLVCFIYDPNGKIDNPEAFIKGIENQSSNNLKIKIIIQPK